ncbi:hypothetical protein ACOMHN_004898 [Nucella lapillus]
MLQSPPERLVEMKITSPNIHTRKLCLYCSVQGLLKITDHESWPQAMVSDSPDGCFQRLEYLAIMANRFALHQNVDEWDHKAVEPAKNCKHLRVWTRAALKCPIHVEVLGSLHKRQILIRGEN